MKPKAAVLGLVAITLVGTMFAGEGPVPKGIPHLDHVFVIMMENHGYSQIVGNPNAPFINHYAQSGQRRYELLCRGAPELDQLSRSRGRIKLRCTQRQ